MAKGSNFFAFIAGVATGVAMVAFSMTEKGMRIIDGIEKALKDEVEEDDDAGERKAEEKAEEK